MGKAQERLLQMERELFNTDIRHPATVNELMRRIMNALTCEEVDRSTLYRDIAVLQQFHPEIVCHVIKQLGFYTEHEILPSDFLFVAEWIGQSQVLHDDDIHRINGLIEKQLFPEARNTLRKNYTIHCDRKTVRGNVCAAMTVLIAAIEGRKRVRFQYEILDPYFRLIPKHDGQWYDISCYRFEVDEHAVYVYAGDAAAKMKKTFRVERMVKIYMSQDKMEPEETYYGVHSNDEIHRQVNESTFHFDGEPVRLSLAVQYEPYIMEVLNDLSHGTAKTIAEIGDGVYRVVFHTRKSDPLIRNLASYADRIRVESPEEVAEGIRNLILSAKRTYGV